MTLRGPSAREAFADADAYAETMAPSLRTMAFGVVYRAALQPGERVLDVGTGTGIGVEAAAGEGREVVGLDLTPQMLALARSALPAHDFVEADFTAIPFGDDHFDVVMSVHALHFAADPVVALREWLRVATAGGRLSLSLPGPAERTTWALYGPISQRHGVNPTPPPPSQAAVKQWAVDAGWQSVATDSDPRTVIRLADEEAFGRWMRIGSRGAALRGRSDAERKALADELLAATPRAADGSLHIPFGTLYLTARAP